MKQIKAETLFPNLKVYENIRDISKSLVNAVNKIPNEKLGKTQEQQVEAKVIIKNWVATLVLGLEFALKNQKLNHQEVKKFKQDFEAKLIEFIKHPDHGILHSYYVYKGMLHLANQNGSPINPDAEDDKQAQLLALLHDITQNVPFTIKNTKFAKRYTHPKNEHAVIISDITKIFGRMFGFNRIRTKQLAYGLEHHDDSYNHNKVHNLKKLDPLSQLLHDSDKIFGGTLVEIDTDINMIIEQIAESMLERNYQANRGENGSYLFRHDLPKDIREKIIYGDRCLSDSVSLVRKEFHLEMCTKAAKEIAEKRTTQVRKAIEKVYGKYFDLTQNFIKKEITNHFNEKNSNLILSIVGMDQEELPLPNTVNSTQSFAQEISRLYQTPIHINNEAKFIDRYGEDQARGLKIKVHNNGKKSDAYDDNSNLYLDPSIARFCFMQDGRNQFLEEITKAFENGIPL